TGDLYLGARPLQLAGGCELIHLGLAQRLGHPVEQGEDLEVNISQHLDADRLAGLPRSLCDWGAVDVLTDELRQRLLRHPLPQGDLGGQVDLPVRLISGGEEGYRITDPHGQHKGEGDVLPLGGGDPLRGEGKLAAALINLHETVSGQRKPRTRQRGNLAVAGAQHNVTGQRDRAAREGRAPRQRSIDIAVLHPGAKVAVAIEEHVSPPDSPSTQWKGDREVKNSAPRGIRRRRGVGASQYSGRWSGPGRRPQAKGSRAARNKIIERTRTSLPREGCATRRTVHHPESA